MTSFPGKARLAAHPVWPSDVRPPELQGRPQPNVSGGLQGQALGVQLLFQQVRGCLVLAMSFLTDCLYSGTRSHRSTPPSQSRTSRPSWSPSSALWSTPSPGPRWVASVSKYKHNSYQLILLLLYGRRWISKSGPGDSRFYGIFVLLLKLTQFCSFL